MAYAHASRSHEVTKQAEWGVHVGRGILDGTTANVWADLQLLTSHAGSVGAFIDTLMNRRGPVPQSFPERAPLLRDLTSTAYVFTSVLAVRNGIAHVDERIEERWSAIASRPEDPPELLVRAEGSINDGRDRMLNWDSVLHVVAFRKRPSEGEGYHEVDVLELVRALETLQTESTRAYMWVLAGMPGLKRAPADSDDPAERG